MIGELEKALMKRAYESGDVLLSKAVINLVNDNERLRFENSQLHLGINPYVDHVGNRLDRLAKITRLLARHLIHITEQLPKIPGNKTAIKQTNSILDKAEICFQGLNLQHLLPDEYYAPE